MASKILLKKSTTASSVPTTSDVDVGEVAVNTEDKRLFTQDNGGSVVELGTTPSSITTSGTVQFGSLSDGTITATGFVDEDNMVSDSATLIPTQQSVKAYVDSQVTAQDLDFQGDSGGALSIDLDSETLTVAGGTGIDTSGSLNTLTVAIDSTVATLTGTQTLTNKTIDSASNTLTLDLSEGTLTGTTAEFNTALSDANFVIQDGSGNVTVSGDLTVNGTTTTVASTNTTIADNLLVLNSGAT